MNEQWQKVLADLITRVTNGADAAIEFGKEQIPEVLRQLLIWNFTISFLTWLLALTIISTYVWFMLVKWRRWVKNRSSTTVAEDNTICCIATLGAILSVIMLIVFFSNFEWLKIWLAPKLYLLEYAASLISHRS